MVTNRSAALALKAAKKGKGLLIDRLYTVLTINTLYTHYTLTIHPLCIWGYSSTGIVVHCTHYALTMHSPYTHSPHTHPTPTIHTHSLHTHYALTLHSLWLLIDSRLRALMAFVTFETEEGKLRAKEVFKRTHTILTLSPTTPHPTPILNHHQPTHQLSPHSQHTHPHQPNTIPMHYTHPYS
jgi:hypothetical protein